MKYRSIAAFFILPLLLALCACNGGGTAIEANESTFLVNFHVDCNEDVYAIHFEYYLDGTPVGGGKTGNADGSRITAGDVFTKDFIPKDFPEGADLSQFQLEIFVIDKNGDEYPSDSILSFETEYGKVYDISIAGSCKNGVSVKQIIG